MALLRFESRPTGLLTLDDESRQVETMLVTVSNTPQDTPYHRYQEMVNAGGVPSESVIEKHVAEQGGEYDRPELAHSVKRFRIWLAFDVASYKPKISEVSFP